MSQIVLHIGATWRIRLDRPCATAMRPYVKLLYFDHLLQFIHPPAAGGGTPEVIAFLNGIIVHGSLSLKNLVVKFTANVFAVSSGLPAAIQAPIITYGSVQNSWTVDTHLSLPAGRTESYLSGYFTLIRLGNECRLLAGNSEMGAK